MIKENTQSSGSGISSDEFSSYANGESPPWLWCARVQLGGSARLSFCAGDYADFALRRFYRRLRGGQGRSGEPSSNPNHGSTLRGHALIQLGADSRPELSATDIHH